MSVSNDLTQFVSCNFFYANVDLTASTINNDKKPSKIGVDVLLHCNATYNTAIVFLNLKGAFDSVWHAGLM